MRMEMAMAMATSTPQQAVGPFRQRGCQRQELSSPAALSLQLACLPLVYSLAPAMEPNRQLQLCFQLFPGHIPVLVPVLEQELARVRPTLTHYYAALCCSTMASMMPLLQLPEPRLLAVEGQGEVEDADGEGQQGEELLLLLPMRT